MGGWLALTKWQLYLVLGAAFALGILGIRAKLLSEGEARLRGALADQRVKAIREAQEVRNDVEALDQDTLRARAAVWVRGNKPKR